MMDREKPFAYDLQRINELINIIKYYVNIAISQISLRDSFIGKLLYTFLCAIVVYHIKVYNCIYLNVY